MNLVRSIGLFNSNICRRFIRFRGLFWYSTATTDSLYRRISPIGDFRVSIVPVLDQWVEEGREVWKELLQNIIKELRRYRRFKHALEISQWMSDKRCLELSTRDVAVRLDLISKVHGIKQAENYFNNIPKELKSSEVYRALLNCYAQQKYVEKAEDLMQKMRELGMARSPSCFNYMLNLYYQTGKHELLDGVMQEMEEKGIKLDKFTFCTRLSAYAAASETEGMDRILQRMESDPMIGLDWNAYAVAASGYMKAGLVDKALAMLKKSERLIVNSKKNHLAFEFLLTQYAATGNKDEVLRLWELYKKTEKIYNKGYMSMISSLLKLDDLEGAKKIFEEWESSELNYDFKVPNFLISVYCRKGLMEKAEDLINRAKSKGGKPIMNTWYFMASGYVAKKQIPKALEAMKQAISMCLPGWKPNKDTLAACLAYLKETGNVEEAEEFIRSFQAKAVVSTEIHDRLLNYIKNGKSKSDVPRLVVGDSFVGDGETRGNSTSERVDDLVGAKEINGISEQK